MSRPFRLAATLVLTGACTAYVVWKIDVSRTGNILADANVGYVLVALAIWMATFVPNAWRWQLLLRARGIAAPLPWLIRLYFVAYTAGQVLPTSVGGDAVRIYESARRHPGRGGNVAASVLLERALGAVATLLLAGVGFLLAIGRYDVGPYLWIALALALGTVACGFFFFSRTLRLPLARILSPLTRTWLGRQLRAVYEGVHAYRVNAPLLAGVVILSMAIQAFGILAIWCTARAVGIELSPHPYYVLGPLLFLVMIIPFTISGIGIRESFFVSFLGGLAVDADSAFAAGFLFFVVMLGSSLPGAGLLAWQGMRGERKTVLSESDARS